MKPQAKRRILFAATTAFVVGISLASPGYSQTVSKELSDAAQTACKSSAVSKGFQVVDVVSVEPKPKTTDGLNVVLNLSRDGQRYKLTCGYTKAAGAAIGETTAPNAVATPTPAPTAATTAPMNTEERGFPWWLLLLPLIGIPLLLWFLRKPPREETVVRTAEARSYAPSPATQEPERSAKTAPDYRNYVTPVPAIVRNNGRSVSVYSGSATSYRVTGSLQDGQQVMLSGRRENDWSELTDGGWVPTNNLDLV